MRVDIGTIGLILGITHLIQVLVFYYQYRINKNIAGPGWWLMWSGTESLAFIFIFLRNIPSFHLNVIVAQNTLLIAGSLFIYIGLLKFFGRKVKWKFVLSFFLSFSVLLLYFTYAVNDITTRSFIISVYLSAISFVTAAVIYKNLTGSIVETAKFNIIVFVLHGCIFTSRALMISLGTPVSNVFSPGFFNFLPYFDALIVSLLWSFGFIIMLNQRLNSEITEAKTHFEHIFNTSPDAVVIINAKTSFFVDCNESFTKMTGFTKDNILGKSSLELGLWKSIAERAEMLKIIARDGFCDNYETTYYRNNGQEITVIISAKILSLKGIPHLITVIHDINERKQAEKEIMLINEELKALHADKDKLFSIIAHDLRSPFNTFLGFTQLLVEKLPELTLPQINEFAVSMRRSALNLFKLLENLLEWSRMEQGLIPFNPETIQILPLIKESLDTGIDTANSKSIEIKFKIPANFEIYADKNMLQTVIRNLMSNAVKFTPRGGEIIISAMAFGNDAVKISITDSGIGMSTEMIENLFRMDGKTNRKGTENEPSSGLGLILCKALIEKHHGKIWVESEEEQGSVFNFTIPYKTNQEELL